MSATELLDDLEAGELSVEFEGEEPEVVLEWAMERFGDRLVLSTAFQEGDVALIDMAYRIDPNVKIFSIDTGRLPTETFELIETLRERYPGLRLTLLSPDATQLQRLVDRHGPNLFYRSIEQRLLCCNVRKVQPLTKHLGGIDAWVTGLRRDQWAGRTDIRKVEIDHDHGAIVKLNPLAEWTEDEVWDYVRENDVPVHPLYAQGYTSIGCAPCTRPDRSRRADARRPLVVGVGRAQGVRDALLDRDGRLRARAARDPRQGRGCQRALASPSRRRSARSRSARCRPCSRPRATRATATGSTALATSVEEGELAGDEAAELERVLELGLQAGRIRAVYGPGGEQAALRLFRRLPAGAELAETARSVSAALAALNGRTLESFQIEAIGPGMYRIALVADGAEVAVRLDRSGVQLASIGV